MALQGVEQKDFPYVMIMEYMIDPVKKVLKESEILTLTQLKETVATIDGITQMIQPSSYSNSFIKERDMVILSAIKDVCFPLFYSLHLLSDSSKTKSDRRKALSSIIHCITVALDQFDDDLLVSKVVFQTMIPLGLVSSQIEHLLSMFKDPEFHQGETTEQLDTLAVLEFFQISVISSSVMTKVISVLDNYGTSKNEFLQTLFQVILIASDTESLFSKAMSTIVKLLFLCPEILQEKFLNELWQKFLQPLPQVSDGNLEKNSLWKSLLVFYCLKDWFFPVDKSESSKLVLTSHLLDEFWLVVQAGMLSSEPSRRKMAMYLLKRLVDTCQQNNCVVNVAGSDGDANDSDVKISDGKRNHSIFWWHPEKSSMLSAIWEDYILLMEVLEEKQVHVIKPILPRVRFLISACSTQSEETKKVPPIMHSSWLVNMITRCFHHESHFLSRWGAITLLTLDMTKVPFVEHGQLKFLSSDLLLYLQENRLYSRYEGSQSRRCCPVREAVTNFFANLFESLNQNEKCQYLMNVLQKIWDNTWGSIPSVFVFQGLSRIPPQPLLSSQAVELVRFIIHGCLTTHETSTRGAIQCFLCEMLMNLVDLEQVSLSDFFTTLAGLNREESFQRGTCLWSKMVEWLKSDRVQQKWTDKLIVTDALVYLKQDEGKGFEGRLVLSVARMLLLFADITMICKAPVESDSTLKGLESCPLGLVLSEISLMLANIGSRSYVNTKHVDASLALLNSLVQELGDTTDGTSSDKVKDLIKCNINANFENVVKYIMNRLSQDLVKAEDLDEIKFYADFISVSGSVCDKTQQPLQDLLKFVGNIFSATLKAKDNSEIDSNLEVLTLSAVTIKKSVCEIVSSAGSVQVQELIWSKSLEMPSIDTIPLPFTTRKSGSRISNLQMGKVISHFVSYKWQCKKFMFAIQTKLGQPFTNMNCLVEDAMDALSIGSGDSDIAVVEALELVIEQLVLHSSVSDIPNFIKMAWSKLMEERKNALFWKRLETLVPTVMHPALLKHNRQPEITTCIEEFLDKLLEVALTKTGVTYLLMQHVTNVLTCHDQDRAIGKWLIATLIDASVFGDIYEKGKRLLLDVFMYIDDIGEQLATNQITSSASKNDLNTRIILISWLSSLKPSVSADHEFVMMFLRCLVDKYLQLANMTTYKQFHNSYHHRLKHRFLLVFLVLSDFIEKDDSQEFLDVLWQGLIVECHPSVRQNLEWAVLRLLLRYPNLIYSIWETFAKFTEKRSICVCSLFMMLTHLGPKLPKDMQTDYYSKAISQAISWSLAHHYNTRIFAQGCLMRLWQQCKEMQLVEVVQSFQVVQCTADFILKNGNSIGTVPKLLDNYMFSSFEPVRDFSAETIFHTLPRLAGISEDEWILPEQLLKQDPSWNVPQGKFIPLLNSLSGLAECSEGPWRMKSHTVNEEDIVETTDGDFQKKIVSWRQMSPDQETEAELITQRRRFKDGGLVLVTSLIDKVPNLGGLCRTSEIFGVSEFVIGNLTHLNDHMFQSLSVSAQKWVNITEVPRHHISKYLEEKKAQGYILVGVEQTANSIPLDKYVFPKNTLLLLGNEKGGIPPDMIQTLDVCVEIPQQGIIRSLNVHVCGALIVWEYTRQLIAQDSS